MLTISKNRVADFLLLDALSELKVTEEKISFFEKKYKTTFKKFSKQIETGKEENFEKWDDSMEWEALINVNKELIEKIQNLKSGRFKIVA